MHRISPVNAKVLTEFILKGRTSPVSTTKLIHTTAAVTKWGDVYLPPDLKKYEQPFPKDFKEHPDRDLVNFPHPVTKAYPSKVRFGVVPDSWFTIFYPKTGVTGGYLFYGGLATYLMSKEYFIVDEEIRLFGIFGLIFFLAYKLGGAQIAKWHDQQWTQAYSEAEDYIENNKKAFTNAIATQKDYIQAYTQLPPLIAEAKRENLQLQLEAEYRKRLLKAHTEIKRRLDYMADLEDAKRRFQRRYMIDWIVEQVKKSITAQQEKALMQQCVADLKGLASRSKV
jgi:F-type H+-transporting ATPase subunit b